MQARADAECQLPQLPQIRLALDAAHLTPLAFAGFLYPPSDYTEASRITADLLASPARRQAVGAAARLEVERWGWLPATQRLREQQYQQAIRRNRGRRWWEHQPCCRALFCTCCCIELLCIESVLLCESAAPYPCCSCVRGGEQSLTAG